MRLDVLLVEDSPGDVRLTQEVFRDANMSAHLANMAIHLHVAADGVEAMAFLRREGANEQAPRPDLILLDLNLPRMDGREVLARIKEDQNLRTIPTVILTTSEAEADIVNSYQLQANCYLSKPVQLDAFENLVQEHQRLLADQGQVAAAETRRLSNTISEKTMPLQVLLVEDSPGDVRLTQEAFRDANESVRLHVASDGVEAMAFLRREAEHHDAPFPDLVLLDLNLPQNGRPRGSGPDQGGRPPEGDSDCHPDHFRVGGGYREQLSAAGELLSQQARAAGRLREPGAEHQRFLADEGEAAAAARGRMTENRCSDFSSSKTTRETPVCSARCSMTGALRDTEVTLVECMA